jgi:hypothetical protein
VPSSLSHSRHGRHRFTVDSDLEYRGTPVGKCNRGTIVEATHDLIEAGTFHIPAVEKAAIRVFACGRIALVAFKKTRSGSRA